MQRGVGTRQKECHGDGFTLVELLIAVTIVVALSAIAVPWYVGYREQQNIVRAVHDLRVLDSHLQAFKVNSNGYPASLNDVPQGNLSDPWGKPYQYLKIEGADTKGKANMRKDKNLVPINSDFDLYSMGADGKTTPPLTAKNSHDDVVRANNGSYYGLASNY
ncbi:MAG TPA: prepilin-type N-terminal cleavage/methylation domain-containing protein [Candidatus Binatia bacterium]